MLKKIMLIDDDESTNLYHEILLEESNKVEQIVICNGVDEAMEHLSNSDIPPEFIFLDINMPVKTGWDFIEEYENLEDSKKAKYLMILSTTRNPIEIERAINNKHVFQFYTKPLTLNMIEQMIDE
ncbi:MAG: response regulator [Saprospiraceae bacterium]|nr:response regulator [Saprospiraceae bacterium]